MRAVAFALALMALANIASLAAVYGALRDVVPVAAVVVAVLGQFAAGAAATVAWLWSR